MRRPKRVGYVVLVAALVACPVTTYFADLWRGPFWLTFGIFLFYALCALALRSWLILATLVGALVGTFVGDSPVNSSRGDAVGGALGGALVGAAVGLFAKAIRAYAEWLAESPSDRPA